MRPDETGEHIVQLYGEDIAIERVNVEQGNVRVKVQTTSRDHDVCEELNHEHVEIDHVPVGRIVDTAPPIRQDGDTTIVSVVEEIVVVERRLYLKEEIHLRRVRGTRTHQETVTLRQQIATVERNGRDAPAGVDINPVRRPDDEL